MMKYLLYWCCALLEASKGDSRRSRCQEDQSGEHRRAETPQAERETAGWRPPPSLLFLGGCISAETI